MSKFKVGDRVQWDDSFGTVIGEEDLSIVVEFKSRNQKARRLRFYKDGSFLKKADMAKLERVSNVKVG